MRQWSLTIGVIALLLIGVGARIASTKPLPNANGCLK